jgi:hypothetical protein
MGPKRLRRKRESASDGFRNGFESIVGGIGTVFRLRRQEGETVSRMWRMGFHDAKSTGTSQEAALPDVAANLCLASKESVMTYWLILSATFAVSIFLTAFVGFCLVAGLGWARAGGRWHRPRVDSWMTTVRPWILRIFERVWSRVSRPYARR